MGIKNENTKDKAITPLLVLRFYSTDSAMAFHNAAKPLGCNVRIEAKNRNPVLVFVGLKKASLSEVLLTAARSNGDVAVFEDL